MDKLRKMRELKRCLQNDIRGLEIEENPDYHGFYLVAPDGWTMYTVYVGEYGFSAYIAIPDIWQGLDISDEKLLVEKVPLFSCVSAIKSNHIQYAPELYAVAPPVNSITDYQLWQRTILTTKHL